MKKVLTTLALVVSVALVSCSGNREGTDNQDSLDAVKSADSMLQNELNADTSANSFEAVDSIGEDNTSTDQSNP